MSYVTLLNEGTRKARKPHQCFDCYRLIGAGELYQFQTCKYDDVYTLCHHKDCREASDFYMNFHNLKFNDFHDGIPPLADIISDMGERDIDFAMLRGHFPHVVCRMELSEQLSEIARKKRHDENKKNFANGGAVKGSGGLVGEHGPEFVLPKRKELPELPKGDGTTIVVNVDG